jgi:cytochrome c-type biogenesis protein CcmH/NrfG
MATGKKSRATALGSDSPLNLILTGVVCLAIGLGIGYYFGRQMAEVSVPSRPAPLPQAAESGASMPVQDPAAFMQQETALKSILAKNPQDLAVLIQIGNLYYDSSRYQQAIDYYTKALEIDPKNPNVQTDLGTSYWNLNQADPAISAFQKSLAVDPTHAQSLYNLGVVYLHGKNDPDSAKKAWKTLLEKNPGYPERAKVEKQLEALSMPQAPAQPPAAPNAQGSGSMQDILERMKSKPQN